MFGRIRHVYVSVVTRMNILSANMIKRHIIYIYFTVNFKVSTYYCKLIIIKQNSHLNFITLLVLVDKRNRKILIGNFSISNIIRTFSNVLLSLRLE